ncbi:ATP-dependent helicase HrpB [Sphingosinicella sp. LHD-64]|uniref:ATP-dependent helicase HrpB n=1 Tax=Sphingosinicella sp. LHD-64 TaxID=3072139 RepID=UPI00280D65D0|nr:ATP-dependent helicase HrpB [Sphingosinicella sp. LHD-64]MDQ8756735.1 ATP-dependent helicase HrpB [Sphingosinicella sp. LHD-64]
MSALPIHDVLPDLLTALRDGSNAVLVAPPGAGKTTAVAPALLGEPWCSGEILLLSPRRLAARAAAERMAALAGGPVGDTIGYATRLDTKRSARTRITVLTEGIFLKRIQADPELAGVSAVLFDEVHERSLDSDFGLALALDAQAALRPDLRLAAMSATLDGARFGALMGDAPVIESEGRSFPVELIHIGRTAERRIEDEMAAAIRRALAESVGGLLAFLPGVAEIERTAERLEPLPAGVDLHRLHGSLDPAAQRAAIAPAPAGTRKLVLATSIAETSLTLDGLQVVVDSGLARRPRYDRAAGLSRLVTERASQAAVTQRAGRAGRQGPGRAYRLWEEAATQSLPRFDPPEILEADLSALLLDCAIWGVSDPRQLRWLDPPGAAAIDEARSRLTSLGALDENGRPTALGQAIADLPLPPRLSHMLIEAAARGWGETAAQAAVLLSERGLGGTDADLDLRIRRWRGERGKRAEAARGLARNWLNFVRSSRAQSRGAGTDSEKRPSTSLGTSEVGGCIALAFPDRLSKRRDSSGADWISVGGRGFRLDPASPLAREDWLAVAEVGGVASGARILSAAAIDQATVETLFADRIRTGADVTFDPATGGVRASHGRRLGAILLSGGQDSRADPAAVEAALLDGVRTHGLGLLPWSEGARSLRRRAGFARRTDPAIPDISDAALVTSLDDWLPLLLPGRRRLADIDPSALSGALDALLGWEGRKAVDRLAPGHFETPAGSSHAIDYEAEAGPTVTARVQAFFGLSEHPRAGDTPLVLALTSPAGRPIQTTRDLPGFWRGSWAAVAKEMRGRYPKHPWPDDPAAADPTLKTKKAMRRSGTGDHQG